MTAKAYIYTYIPNNIIFCKLPYSICTYTVSKKTNKKNSNSHCSIDIFRKAASSSCPSCLEDLVYVKYAYKCKLFLALHVLNDQPSNIPMTIFVHNFFTTEYNF